MLEASCHCGAVRFAVEAPSRVRDCNCSICRRYGVLWAYYPRKEVEFAAIPDTATYSWGPGQYAFHHCRTCKCLTHVAPVEGKDESATIGVNVRLLHDLDVASVQLIQTDNGGDGMFWTKSETHERPGRYLECST